ncbi:ankyrin repeat-containing domain protein [Xylaria sp. FL1042]|nr:ankyrin repeat-containing domain protein [Xylaria sp. FL1042]
MSHPLLVDIPDKQGYTPLMSAVKQGMQEVVMSLINAGADVNGRAKDGSSALQIAIENDSRELVGLLLRSNARTAWEGFSLMHWAANHGYQEIVLQLHNRGEDVDFITSEGSPMACAVQHGHGMLVWHLLSCGAELEVSGLDGNTALHTFFIATSTPRR